MDVKWITKLNPNNLLSNDANAIVLRGVRCGVEAYLFHIDFLCLRVYMDLVSDLNNNDDDNN